MEQAGLARALWVLAGRLAAAAGRGFAGCAPPSSAGRLVAPEAASSAGVGGGSSRGASAAATLAATTVAAIAASLFGSTVALCEASKGGGMSPAEIKEAVTDLWRRLDEQLHRVEASLPRGTHLQDIPQPDVSIAGDEVEVTWSLPQQLDIPGAVRALRRALRSPAFASVEEGSYGSSVSESSSSGGEGRATTFVRRSRGLGGLTVEVSEPYNASQPARFCFRGRASERDLALMTAALQAAMQPRRRGPVEEFQEWGSLFEGSPFGRGLEGAVDPFFEHLQEFFRGFERMAQGEGWQLDDDDERDTEPTPLRRPKRFDDWGSGGSGGSEQWPRRLEGGGRPHGSAAPGGAAEGPSQEQLEQQRRARQLDSVARKLEKNGAQVFIHDPKDTVDWGILAGYEEQKRQIEDTLLLALLHPEVYESIAKGTRRQFASNRPRAVLFEGPPGTGKTTSARVIASQAAVPLVYIPLEAVVSKWYGESEKMLADMLKTCEQFPDGCIIFLDELDALATSRSTEMHEATRRVLGVLLRHLDGFDSTNKRTVVIGATNRKQDLDPALISRFSTSVNFGLPNESCRAEILKQYARHLGDAEVLAVAHATPGMAGRDLKDICEQAERRWASKIIRGQAQKGQLPPLREYLEAASQRLRELAGLPDGDIGSYQTT
ncbi:cell division cycle 48-like protein [Chlorella sorokiniana]|uniref:Cell division cycle 48-like protein n=1 Tax=Chlorella sorokiniana TaxID=3076 RepID=A0A2P6U0D3_CHLSO|nr:cell division cycle 48-like protein [Chlorella sorokiniana]|eukprot:PRW59773.1 cell division cycle 48-like protein [Chlorella sorokiniana]